MLNTYHFDTTSSPLRGGVSTFFRPVAGNHAESDLGGTRPSISARSASIQRSRKLNAVIQRSEAKDDSSGPSREMKANLLRFLTSLKHDNASAICFYLHSGCDLDACVHPALQLLHKKIP